MSKIGAGAVNFKQLNWVGSYTKGGTAFTRLALAYFVGEFHVLLNLVHRSLCLDRISCMTTYAYFTPLTDDE